MLEHITRHRLPSGRACQGRPRGLARVRLCKPGPIATLTALGASQSVFVRAQSGTPQTPAARVCPVDAQLPAALRSGASCTVQILHERCRLPCTAACTHFSGNGAGERHSRSGRNMPSSAARTPFAASRHTCSSSAAACATVPQVLYRGHAVSDRPHLAVIEAMQPR